LTQQRELAKSVKLVHVAMAYAKQGVAATAHRWFDTSERWTADFAAGNVELKQIRREAAEVLNLKLEPPPQLSKTTDP
jgi:hypothetical protein